MEVIADPQFETLGQRESYWHIEAHEGAGIAAQGVEGVGVVEVASPYNIEKHAELRYAPFSVQRGQEVLIKFEAYADKEMPFSFSLSEWHEPWRSLLRPNEKFGEWMLETEWRHYEHSCHIIHDENEARLNFTLGGANNRVYLANVSLQLTAPEA